MSEKLLLHVCCAPCLSGAHKALAPDGFDITGFFFNPNIHPEEEFIKRQEAMKKYSSLKDFHVIFRGSCGIDLFKKEVEGKPGDRCANCYRLRLERTAFCASQNDFDSFSTTILISPYQKHEIVRDIGDEMADKYGINFYYRDMRPYYKDSIAISKELGLYRQKYCGCRLSGTVKTSPARPFSRFQ